MRLIDADTLKELTTERNSIWNKITDSNDRGLEEIIDSMPTVDVCPTVYGYNIEHLELIARILQKENLSPYRTADLLTDIGAIVAMVVDEFEEQLKKAVENVYDTNI